MISKKNLLYQISLSNLLKDKTLIILLIILLPFLVLMFTHHMIPNINGDLYTGESTYGDLPFHLSTISQLAYSQTFPPQHPMYTGIPLVYPYLINLFSAILVIEGISLQQSLVIPGLIFSLSLAAIIYDFIFALTKKKSISLISVLLYFFNGGFGFYFFLQTYHFNFFEYVSK